MDNRENPFEAYQTEEKRDNTVINLGDGKTPIEPPQEPQLEKGNSSTGSKAFLIFYSILMVVVLGLAAFGYYTDWFDSVFFRDEPVEVEEFITPETPAPTPEPIIYAEAFPAGVVGNLSDGRVSSGWDMEPNTGKLSPDSAPYAREKLVSLKGSGEDRVTVMVYMCGGDLESGSAMALHDLNEMKKASLNDNISLLVLTGGCRKWRTKDIASDANRLYQIKDGELCLIEGNMGYGSMTDPDILSYFIRYCQWKYPADRNILIMWGSGGNGLDGWGYDELHPEEGSMTASDIAWALSSSKASLDLVGFDAPMAASIENALVLSKYADYMIAPETTTPEDGWYYTDWLTALSERPSLKTVLLGKMIIDDSIEHSDGETAMSLIDLSELSESVPDRMRRFWLSLIEMLNHDGFAEISAAVSAAKELSLNECSDQIDLVHFANMFNSSESSTLVRKLLSAVKYNRAGDAISNVYGLSVYFPHRNIDRVAEAMELHNSIGFPAEYAQLIEGYSAMLYVGRAISMADSYSAYTALLGKLSGSTVYGAGQQSGYSSIYVKLAERLDLDKRYEPTKLDVEAAAAYINANRFFPTQLLWDDNGGKPELILTEDNWGKVQRLTRNVFLDTGNGFADLGEDTVFSFGANGALKGESSTQRLTVNGQTVAFYHVNTVHRGDEYIITGRIPMICNNRRAELVVKFDNEHPDGYIAGMYYDYRDDETGTVPKLLKKVRSGLRISFICGYYSYGGSRIDDYRLGETFITQGELTLGEDTVQSAGDLLTGFCLTDIYGQSYWTPVLN